MKDNVGTIYPKSGDKNYITQPSNANSWTASGGGITVATDSTAADLPRPNTTKTGILLTGVSGSTAYAYFRFILDDADASQVMKVQFAMKPGTAVASDFKIDVYSNTASDYTTGNTRIALATDSAAVSALPALTGTYRTSFTAPAIAAKYIEVRIGMNTTQTHTLVISDVVVGPGISTYVGSVASTFTFNGSGGTSASKTLNYQRLGDWVTLHIPGVTATSGTSSTILTANTAVDIWARPATTYTVFPMMTTYNNGVATSNAGYGQMSSAGILSFQRTADGATFTNSSTCGMVDHVTVTYYVGAGS